MRVRTSHFTHFRVTLENSHRQSERKEKGGKQRAPITFSISGRAELSSGSRRMLRPTLVLIINSWGFGSGCHFFFSPFFAISSTPHLLFSYATNLASDFIHRAFAFSREHYTVAADYVHGAAPRVDRIAKVPITLSSTLSK